MFKKISLFIVFLLINTNSQASTGYNFSKEQEESYNKLGKSIPIVKVVPENLKNSQSIQKIYFELKGSFEFNKSVMPYYLNNIENFNGYSSKKELISYIPELSGLYNKLKSTNNAVTRFRIDKDYKDTFERFSNDFDINFFKDKLYYSEIPLKGAFPYDFKNNNKTVIFSDYKESFPAIYLTCFPDGNIIASFTANQFKAEKSTILSFVTTTPIILEVSQEIKDYIKHRPSQYGKNLCTNTREFRSIEDGEIFEGYSNNKSNTYMGFFTIDTTITNKPYLVGKLSHIGYFIMDSDYYHMPFDIVGGYTFNEENIESIPDKVLDNIKNKEKFSNTFLTSKFSYTFSDFFFKGTEKNQVNLIKNSTDLYIIYDYEILENEVIFTLNKIIKDSPDNFPLKFRIIKDKEGDDLTAYVLYRDSPFIYIEEDFNFKNGVFIDWDGIINKK
jgi:hypothetical protein